MTRLARLFLSALVAAVFLTGAFAAPAKYPSKTMDFIAPAGAGGGWDTTIRMVAKSLQDEKLVPVAMPVTNRPGGGGGVALAYIVGKSKADDIVVVYSPPLILNQVVGASPYGWKNLTPLARLITDYGAFYVGKGSKLTLKDVMEKLKQDPTSLKIGGTSGAGSMDHIQFLMAAKAYGVKDIKKIPYIAFQDNSGPSQLMGGHIDVFSGGIGELRGLVDSGDLVPLAVTSPERIPAVKNYPTCVEQGVNVVFTNWRGLFGPQNMPQYAVDFWRKALGDLSKSATWQKVMEQNAWAPAYLDQGEFKAFLDKNYKDFYDILSELGMAK